MVLYHLLLSGILLLLGMLLLVARPWVVMVAMTTAVTRAILALLYAVACIVQLRQELLEPVVVAQLEVLGGMVAERIWVGIWALGREMEIGVAQVVGELPGEIIVVGMTLVGITGW